MSQEEMSPPVKNVACFHLISYCLFQSRDCAILHVLPDHAIEVDNAVILDGCDLSVVSAVALQSSKRVPSCMNVYLRIGSLYALNRIALMIESRMPHRKKSAHCLSANGSHCARGPKARPST